MTTLFEYFDTGSTGVYDTYGVIWLAQTFTIGAVGPNINHLVSSMWFMGYRTGNPGLFTLSLRGVDGIGQPTAGPDLCYKTVNANNFVDAPATWYEFIMNTMVLLSINTKYAMVIRAPSGDGSNYVSSKARAGGNAYSGGSYFMSNDSGNTWTETAVDDMYFREYGLPATVDMMLTGNLTLE